MLHIGTQLFHAVLAIVRERCLGLLVISHDLHLIRRVSDRLIDWETLIRQSEETV
ncbi:MAG: hypothetical protein BSOLF_0667 [Candidatus Carbobacillus altaicus]|uniref:Uncharacterized protein n=1 Tax=Candidatus Carbonibacillus altaicus TaxID=2163959 RepID=A0A2R6Y575_9BACL|nr:MAG: hypothetical protein BSOLF_0667 [Candidatus Carbobacillus altaicus]